MGPRQIPCLPSHFLNHIHNPLLCVGVWPYVRRKNTWKSGSAKSRRRQEKVELQLKQMESALGQKAPENRRRVEQQAVSLTGTRWLQKRHWQLSFARTLHAFSKNKGNGKVSSPQKCRKSIKQKRKWNHWQQGAMAWQNKVANRLLLGWGLLC